MAVVEETLRKEETAVEEEDDEHECKERVLQKYFLQEWKVVKSLLENIVSNGRVSDPSSVHRIRSIVSSLLLPTLSISRLLHYDMKSD